MYVFLILPPNALSLSYLYHHLYLYFLLSCCLYAYAYAVPEDIQLQKLVNDRILPMEEVLKDLRAEKVAEAKTYRKPNPAFQPCAVEEFDSKDRKYLAWNLTGSIIFRRANMTDSNRYEIRFSDGSRKPVGFSDPRNYDIGALSENGVVLACPIDEENKTASRIYYFAFPSAQITDANETFSIDLPKNEVGTIRVLVS